MKWIIATLATLLVTYAMEAIHLGSTVCCMVYLVLLVWFATHTGLRLSAFLAVLSATLTVYYFIPPRRSFQIDDATGWTLLISYLAACVLVSRIAEQARKQTRQAEQRRADVERLFALAQEMMLHDDAQGLVRDMPRLVERLFELDSVLLYVRDQDTLYSSSPGRGSELCRTMKAITGTHETIAELPQGYVPQNLVLGMKSVGAIAWKPDKLSREVASAMAAQVAIALTRSLAVEASARLEAARSSDRLRTALIDSLTHELRTPLTAIRAAATTMLESLPTLDDETRTELASIVDEESRRLDALIGEAIEMAEIDAESIKVQMVPMHTRTVLEQATEESRELLSRHRVVVSVEGPDEPLWLDPQLIGRVLRHLLENAARYTPAGTRVVLRSRRLHERLQILVEDNGPGIDAYDLPLIFEKFYRGKRGAEVVRTKGSGMGLAITRAILAAHGGTIEVDSRPGQGTRFNIFIPANQVAPLNKP